VGRDGGEPVHRAPEDQHHQPAIGLDRREGEPRTGERGRARAAEPEQERATVHDHLLWNSGETTSRATACAAGAWASEAGLDFWNLPAERAALGREASAAEELARQRQAVLSRVSARHALAEELVAGRTPLADVAAGFAELNRQTPGRVEGVREAFPSPSDEASAAQQAIELARGQLRRGPAGSAGVLRRLEAEYEARWGELPGPL
jgi:hypothetical protein